MTIIKEQVSKSAAHSKMRRLVGNTHYGTIGFCDIHCYQEIPDGIDPKDLPKNEGWVIKLSSTYHAESTMERMYKTNGKEW